jgi:RNA polymerase sigma-70 factor, ECF subfamily
MAWRVQSPDDVTTEGIETMNSEVSFGPREWRLAYAVALRVLGAPDQAEDAAQEALLNAFLARAGFAGRSAPSTWLYRIARNTALSHRRKLYGRRHGPLEPLDLLDGAHQVAANDAGPEDEMLGQELSACVRRGLAQISAADREAFTRRFLLGMTEQELGASLGVSSNAAKQRAFRARRALRCYVREAGLG